MNFRTKQYLRKRFRDYYQFFHLTLPPDFNRREWGFILFDELPEVVMRRHKAFSSEQELLEYIRGMVPAHVYCSSAYYQFPNASTMKEKQWQGADLIFDLDADHLPQKPKSYAEMLYNVKNETYKLLDFLLDDLGFSENSIGIVFSGGRGYHIHVRDPKVLSLGSKERREIIDYVSGRGLNTDILFRSREMVYDMGKFKKKIQESPIKIRSFDASDISGWGKRISRYLIHFLNEISRKDENKALDEIINVIKAYHLKKASTYRIAQDVAEKIVQMKKQDRRIGLKKIANKIGVSSDAVRKVLIKHDLWDFRPEAMLKLKTIKEIAQNKTAINMIKKGIIDFPDTTYIFEAIVYQAVQSNSVYLGMLHTDEPVTGDVKRLIRMPSSLHGGTGMKVVPLCLSEFEEFDPLDDAIVFSEKEIKIQVIPPLKPQNSIIEMKGKSFRVQEGINTLPEYVAIYLMCRGAAEYA